MITTGEWKYGVRRDGSMWLSLGNPQTGPHYEGDLTAAKEDADLIVCAPDLAAALMECADALEAEINGMYPEGERKAHQTLQRSYDRDMKPVLAARAALLKAGVK